MIHVLLAAAIIAVVADIGHAQVERREPESASYSMMGTRAADGTDAGTWGGWMRGMWRPPPTPPRPRAAETVRPRPALDARTGESSAPANTAAAREGTTSVTAMPSMSHAQPRPFYDAYGSHLLLIGAGVATFVGYRAVRRRQRRAVAPAGFVTEAVLVVDLVGSTHLATHYGDRAAMQGRLDLRDLARAEAEKRGLVFTESTGDGRLMTFDTVPQAVETAVALLRRLAAESSGAEGIPFAMRAAITYGEILLDVRGGRHGAVLNKAFRLEGLTEDQLVRVEGHDGKGALPADNRVLLDEEAAQEIERCGLHARPVGFCRLKGFSGLHRVYLLSALQDAPR